jgi:hypothetical protein
VIVDGPLGLRLECSAPLSGLAGELESAVASVRAWFQAIHAVQKCDPVALAPAAFGPAFISWSLCGTW